jgi:hypothetical protein
MKDLFNFLDSNKQSGGKPAAGEGPATLVDSSTGSPGINKQQAAPAEGKLIIILVKIFVTSCIFFFCKKTSE